MNFDSIREGTAKLRPKGIMVNSSKASEQPLLAVSSIEVK